MSDQIILPLVPPSLGGEVARRPAVERARPASSPPLAAVPEMPAVLSDVVYGMGRLDEAGRVFDHAVVACLGWRPGDRLTIAGTPAVVLARREPDGLIVLPARPCLVIPARLRHRSGLRTGDRVVLAAYPQLDRLVIYPLVTVHEALARHLDPPPPTGPREPPPTTGDGQPDSHRWPKAGGDHR